MKTLGTPTSWGIIEPITSNSIPVCIRCGVKITKENDSGWNVFTEDGRTTQPVCKTCDEKDDGSGKKIES